MSQLMVSAIDLILTDDGSLLATFSINEKLNPTTMASNPPKAIDCSQFGQAKIEIPAINNETIKTIKRLRTCKIGFKILPSLILG